MAFLSVALRVVFRSRRKLLGQTRQRPRFRRHMSRRVSPYWSVASLFVTTSAAPTPEPVGEQTKQSDPNSDAVPRVANPCRFPTDWERQISGPERSPVEAELIGHAPRLHEQDIAGYEHLPDAVKDGLVYFAVRDDPVTGRQGIGPDLQNAAT